MKITDIITVFNNPRAGKYDYEYDEINLCIHGQHPRRVFNALNLDEHCIIDFDSYLFSTLEHEQIHQALFRVLGYDVCRAFDNSRFNWLRTLEYLTGDV
jgi:hypothetical protein